MLAAANRLGDASSFREATRRGQRAGSRTLVVHTLDAERAGGAGVEQRCGGSAGPTFGLVVSRAVGNSVMRNRVKRRLRHLLRERVSLVPDGHVVVVRALPASAGASSAGLARDLDRCLDRVLAGRDGRGA